MFAAAFAKCGGGLATYPVLWSQGLPVGASILCGAAESVGGAGCAGDSRGEALVAAWARGWRAAGDRGGW
jgi:hypothetical protein